jgi:hypothetical protein
MPPSPNFRPAGLLTPVVELTAGLAAAAAFATSSALRRARTFHPDGVAFEATVAVPPPTTGGTAGDDVLPAGEHRALVRFSRGVGLPERFADVLGLAVRLVDLHGPGAHQDLLLVTSGAAVGARHALVPARSFGHDRWSTLLPYAVGRDKRRVVFGARPLAPGLAAVTTLDGLRAAGDVRYSLDLAPVRGDWAPLATLTVGDELPAAAAEGLRFNPANTGGAVEPVGAIQAVRRLAYEGSQTGRASRT